MPLAMAIPTAMRTMPPRSSLAIPGHRAAVRREYDHQPDAPAASCVAPCALAAVPDITGRMLLVRRCDTGDWPPFSLPR